MSWLVSQITSQNFCVGSFASKKSLPLSGDKTLSKIVLLQMLPCFRHVWWIHMSLMLPQFSVALWLQNVGGRVLVCQPMLEKERLWVKDHLLNWKKPRRFWMCCSGLLHDADCYWLRMISVYSRQVNNFPIHCTHLHMMLLIIEESWFFLISSLPVLILPLTPIFSISTFHRWRNRVISHFCWNYRQNK